jgi:CHAT domain-containing protein/tetratricopeptide (TPR) repeat protein
MIKWIFKLTILFIISIICSQVNSNSIPDSLIVKKLLEEKNAFLEENQYEEAIEKLIEATSIYQKNSQWAKVVNGFNEAALLSDNTSNELAKANYIEQATVLAQKHLDENHFEVGILNQRKGEFFIAIEKYDSANYFLNEAIEILKHNQKWEDCAWASITLAVSHYYQGTYTDMETSLLNAETIVQQHQLGNDILDAVYELFGVLYFHTTEDYSKTIATTKRSLNLTLAIKNKSTVDSSHIANIYNNLGVFYQDIGDLTRSSRYFQMALSLYEKINYQDFRTSDILLNKGKTHSLKGEEYEAIHHFQKALAFNKNNQPVERAKNKAKIYNFLGQSYIQLNKLDSALYFINEAEKYALGESKSLNLITKSYLLNLQNQHNDALKIIQPIIDSVQQSETYSRLFIKYRAYKILGEIYFAKKEYNNALDAFEKALAINSPDYKKSDNYYLEKDIKEVLNIEFSVEILNNEAKVFEAINTKESNLTAFQTYQLAIKWIEKMRHNLAFEESKIRLNKKHAILYKSAIQLAYRLYEETEEQVYLDNAFVIAEKQKGIILLESLIDERGKKYFGVPDELLLKEQTIKNNIAFYQQKMLEKRDDSTKYALYQHYFNDFNLQLATVKDTLQTFYKEYFDLEYQTSIADIPTVQKELVNTNTAFVQYINIDSLSYVFIIEKEKSHFLALPYRQEEKTLIQAFQRNLSSPTSVDNQNDMAHFKAFNHLSYQTYQTVFEPVVQQLSKNIDAFIIVPDGAMSHFPFEILVNKIAASTSINYIQLPYLIRDYQFQYGYSGTLLVENKNNFSAVSSNSEILAYAPAYQNTTKAKNRNLVTRENVASLEGTANEINAISEYFKGTFDATEKATESNFKNEATDYGILHLAMHGKADLNYPDFAHLVFSNVEKDTTDDGLLYHYEIAQMDIKAQLAVLSACETGVGKNVEGEGIMSLGRGFMYAGVPSVVMSLWKMNDYTSSQLMPMFYKNLFDGFRKDKALRKAKLDYLNSAAMEQAHPFYWAGFVGFGDGQAIKQQNSYSKFYWIGGFAILVIGFFLIRKSK